MVRSIQKQLNRLGCNAGTADGILGRKTLSPLKRWKYAGGNYTPNKIDQRLRSSLFESPYKCSSAQTSNISQASPGLLSGTWDVTYSRCDNKSYRSILSLYSSKPNEYEAIYNVQNRIYKGKLNIAGDKYTTALKGPGGLVSGNGILNKTFTRAQGRDHMGCLFDATKR
jgi:peptidoglycan hydrolase-like protein with peptidoglycan-binding domain